MYLFISPSPLPSRVILLWVVVRTVFEKLQVTRSLYPIAGGHGYLGQSGWVSFRVITGLGKVTLA